MICWYCHWGWARPVAEIYKAALEKLDGYSGPLHCGPSHIVWEDENWDSADWCLENFEKYAVGCGYSDEELAVVRWSLEELAKLPLEQREIEPDDYDGFHPERYPPAVEVVKM